MLISAKRFLGVNKKCNIQTIMSVQTLPYPLRAKLNRNHTGPLEMIDLAVNLTP